MADMYIDPITGEETWEWDDRQKALIEQSQKVNTAIQAEVTKLIDALSETPVDKTKATAALRTLFGVNN